MKNELSQKDLAALDRKIERLETKIVEVKHNYDELLSQYTELFELRHPEKKSRRRVIWINLINKWKWYFITRMKEMFPLMLILSDGRLLAA